MFSNLKEDLAAVSGDGSVANKIKIILLSHAFHIVVCYRAGAYLSKTKLIGSFLRVLFEYFIRVFYASDISLKSKVGAGLIIMHGHDIVIGSDVVIGKNCKILNGVTLGNKDTTLPVNEQPVLGDNVVLGSGAKLLGKIHIGDHVIVGANSVVLKDAPAGATVVGVPARVVKEHSA